MVHPAFYHTDDPSLGTRSGGEKGAAAADGGSQTLWEGAPKRGRCHPRGHAQWNHAETAGGRQVRRRNRGAKTRDKRVGKGIRRRTLP